MATIHFGLEQQRFTGGASEVELDAPNVKQLIAKLDAKFPGIGPILESSAVAINGEVVNDAAYEPVPAGAEVYFVVNGTGTMHIDGTEVELRPGRFVRVDPGSTRMPVAGPDGLEFVTFGAPLEGDYEPPDWG